jgi:predicted DNA-binding protein
MKKSERFNLRISHEEKEMVKELSQRLKRKQSCALLYVIRELLEMWKNHEGSDDSISPHA